MMSTKLNNRTSANDLYDIYLTPELLHKYKKGYKITEGVNDVAVYENCFWMLDMILEQETDFEFKIEFWELRRVDKDLFTLTAKNKLGLPFIVIKEFQTDFYFDDLTIVKKGKLFCLPIEENIY